MRGLPFELTARTEWKKAFRFTDARRDYGEERVTRLGAEGRTAIRRLLSPGAVRSTDHQFPQANDREERAYDQATTD